jgi:uncharacterized protein YceH (UPF0502 family)
MLSLSPDECRVLGVLIEKAQTTPQQYPLTLNSLTTGCNQKNNRDPVTDLDDDTVFAAVDSLRTKNVVREVFLSGSRVQKFRHVARETLGVNTEELVLRGPQSVGELRGRAARMVPDSGLESLEKTQQILDAMSTRPEPLVKMIPAPPGGRAPLFVQQFCPNLHPLNRVPAPSLVVAQRNDDLAGRVAELEREIGELRSAISRLASRLGEADPFGA